MTSARPVATTTSGSSDGSGRAGTDFSVLSLNRRAADLLDTAFPFPIWLRGELASTPRTNSAGHTYFQLVERSSSDGQPAAAIDCALFAGSRTTVIREFARSGLLFDPVEGAELRLEGRVSLWDRGGRYQFIVQRIDPLWAMGGQAARLRQLVDALSREGVLSANGELPIPGAPLHVGLVTSKGSAACEDFLHGLRASGFPFRVFAAWSPMQGEGTAEGVMRAFNALLRVPDLDVAVLTRGGGSATDLGWFDDERIARTIAQLPWPVISGIGHETDSTLPDFAAHTRAKTPTDAADILVNRTADFLETVGSLAVVLERSATRSISRERIRLAARAESLTGSAGMLCRARMRELGTTSLWLRSHAERALRSAGRLLERLAARPGSAPSAFPRRRGDLDAAAGRLAAAVNGRLSTSGLLLDRLGEAVRGNDPARLYRAGWATVTDASGRSVRSLRQVGTGDPIRVRVVDGAIDSTVLKTIPDASRRSSARSSRKRTENE